MNQQVGRKKTVEALRLAKGNMTAAAKLLGLDRSTVARRVRESPELQRVCEEILEQEIDLHEDVLRKLAIEKEQTVPVLAFLNNKARHRNWGRPADDGGRTTERLPSQAHFHLHFHGASAAAPCCYRRLT